MDIKQAIRQSVDMQYYRSQFTVLTIATAVMTLMLFLPFVFIIGWRALWQCLLVLPFMLPFVLYYLLRMRELYRDAEKFKCYEAVLDDQRPGWFRGTMYFTAHFTDECGRAHRVQTRAVFSMSCLHKNYFGDYVRQQVKVAYDAESQALICLHPLTE